MNIPKLTDAQKLAVKGTNIIELKQKMTAELKNCEPIHNDIEDVLLGALAILYEKIKCDQEGI